MTKVETIRNWIACPQFGDDHYGELGALPYRERKILKDLCDYVEPLEYHDMEMTKTVIELQQRIDKISNYLEENRKQYIYQDGLGEDWYFEDLGVFDELLKILGDNNE